MERASTVESLGEEVALFVCDLSKRARHPKRAPRIAGLQHETYYVNTS
jgi:hypothetical protein